MSGRKEAEARELAGTRSEATMLKIMAKVSRGRLLMGANALRRELSDMEATDKLN